MDKILKKCSDRLVLSDIKTPRNPIKERKVWNIIRNLIYFTNRKAKHKSKISIDNTNKENDQAGYKCTMIYRLEKIF